MDVIGLKGERVRLVPPDRERHLENGLRWMNDPEVTGTIELNFGITRRQEEKFFEHIELDRETQMHWAIVTEDDRHIGFIGLHLINWRHRSTSGGLLIGERADWGRGYATDAVRTRTRFVFEQMGLHRLEGHTFNPAMRRVYEKCGYHHEGTARQKMWRDGRWHDVELYAILAADHFATRPN
ncbi:MAG TPA: GNAT family protein [Isosphaeraceae bacterium]|nr:GNAT family protein [Isosphaeraceae bacterium]